MCDFLCSTPLVSELRVRIAEEWCFDCLTVDSDSREHILSNHPGHACNWVQVQPLTPRSTDSTTRCPPPSPTYFGRRRCSFNPRPRQFPLLVGGITSAASDHNRTQIPQRRKTTMFSSTTFSATTPPHLHRHESSGARKPSPIVIHTWYRSKRLCTDRRPGGRRWSSSHKSAGVRLLPKVCKENDT